LQQNLSVHKINQAYPGVPEVINRTSFLLDRIIAVTAPTAGFRIYRGVIEEDARRPEPQFSPYLDEAARVMLGVACYTSAAAG
jgi:hypothetical protein